MTQLLLRQAISLHRQGDFNGAERLYRQVLEEVPSHRDALHMVAVISAQQGRQEEACEIFESLLVQNSSDPIILTNYANVLSGMRRYELAIEKLEAALTIDPNGAERWNSSAMVRRGLGQFEAALADLNRALALQPNHLLIQRNRGDILKNLGRYREALEIYQELLGFAPGDAMLWNNRGICLLNLRQLEAASESLLHAASLAPQLAEAQFNLGRVRLLQGDFEQGLSLYELRKALPEPIEKRVYAQPLWTGSQDLRGKHLFCYIEQGLGDAIQFYRFIAMAQARGATVTLSIYHSLIRLFRNAAPCCDLISYDEIPTEFDYHIPLMSLPLAFGITVNNIPAPRRYMAAEPARVEHWARRLGAEDFRIGVAWRGRGTALGAEGKEFPLSSLLELSRSPGVRLISLQKDVRADEVPKELSLELSTDFDEGRDAFVDTAAIIENLDLVISADSVTAHLAGALGAPTWVALKCVPDWRWLLDRADTPWYPMVRLFRQREAGDWSSPFNEMSRALAAAGVLTS